MGGLSYVYVLLLLYTRAHARGNIYLCKSLTSIYMVKLFTKIYNKLKEKREWVATLTYIRKGLCMVIILSSFNHKTCTKT